MSEMNLEQRIIELELRVAALERTHNKQFQPPTEDQVYQHMKGLDENKHVELGDVQTMAAEFFNHFESVNWYRGKAKMRNWKAAARNWCMNSAFKFENKRTMSYHKPL